MKRVSRLIVLSMEPGNCEIFAQHRAWTHDLNPMFELNMDPQYSSAKGFDFLRSSIATGGPGGCKLQKTCNFGEMFQTCWSVVTYKVSAPQKGHHFDIHFGETRPFNPTCLVNNLEYVVDIFAKHARYSEILGARCYSIVRACRSTKIE